MAEDNKKINDEEIEESEVEEGKEEVSSTPIEGLQEGIVSGITDFEFASQMKEAFLDYAVSTLTSRSVPDARDGLKPVQRRIIYDMYDMGITPDKPFKKSARVVGDVMGKYHPHGDSAIYLAMCRLAQDFSMRYMLVEGHGNFGTPDGDEPAASRYTEARLSKIALEMTRDIEKDTVPFVDTYDAEGQEPVILPSRFPNLLCNETSGIAVGMATSIPPHNLKETISACQTIITNPDISTIELMDIIKGPDFPGGATILGRAGIRKYFETGRGSIKIRAKYVVEENNGKCDLTFYEFPYMVNKKDLAKHIAELADDKVIEGIASVADYSSKKAGTRFVVSIKKGYIPEIVANHLYKYTSLQSTFGVNMLALDNGSPKVLNMKQALTIYINFQKDVIKRRTQYDLKKAEDRIHIITGLLIVSDAIEEAVRIIRSASSNEDATEKLKVRFSLDDIQCKAILDMTLRRLTGIEQKKLIDEKTKLEESCKFFLSILNDEEVLKKVLIDELEEIKNKYGDERRTEISDTEYSPDNEDLIPNKEILVILTKSGYIKRLDPNEFKTQNRGGVGIRGMKTKEDDEVELLVHSRTKTDVLFFTNIGRVYRTRGYTIQEGSRISKGIPAVNFLKLNDGEKINSIISMNDYDENSFIFFTTKKGVVKRCSVADFKNININGKIAIGLKDGDELLDVKHTDGTAIISLASSDGLVCSFYENTIRSMGRTAAGVRGMRLNKGAEVVGLVSSLDGNKIFSLGEHGYGKITDGTQYRITNRGGKGVRTLKDSEKAGKLLTIKTVKGDEDLILITNAGTTMRTSLTSISEVSRNTIGVKTIRLRDNETISSCLVLPSESEYEAKDEIIEEDIQEVEEEVDLNNIIVDKADIEDEE